MKKQKINKHPDWRLSRSEKNWYYVGDTARLFCTSLVGSYMGLFLIFQGINMASLATAILIVKLIDAVDDVLFGFIIDKIDITKWKLFSRLAGKGKYMPWYRLFFWTFPVATILFFLMPQSASDAVKIVWFVVTYLLYDFTCTLTEVPMQSMVSTLTDNPSERNSVLTVKVVITVIAAVGFAVIVQALISESVGIPLRNVGIGGAVIFLVFMLPMVFKVHEHNTELKNVENEGSQEQYTFRDMLNCVTTNKYIMVYFLAVIVSTLFCTRTAVETFIGFYIYHDSMIFTYVMLIGFVPGIVLSGFCGKIADKFGKRNTLAFIFALITAASLIIYFFGRDNKVFFIVIGGRMLKLRIAANWNLFRKLVKLIRVEVIVLSYIENLFFSWFRFKCQTSNYIGNKNSINSNWRSKLHKTGITVKHSRFRMSKGFVGAIQGT